jgi:hypothetical protein
LKSALKDAYAVYAVTNFWESKDPATEIKQGKAIADAAKVIVKPCGFWPEWQASRLDPANLFLTFRKLVSSISFGLPS